MITNDMCYFSCKMLCQSAYPSHIFAVDKNKKGHLIWIWTHSIFFFAVMQQYSLL